MSNELKVFDHIEFLMQRRMDEELDIQVDKSVDVDAARIMINAVNAMRIALNEIMQSETIKSYINTKNEEVDFMMEALALFCCDRILTFTKAANKQVRKKNPLFLIDNFMKILNSSLNCNKDIFSDGL